jgi:hypothetical protein
MRDIRRDMGYLATELTRYAPTHGAAGDQPPFPLKLHDVHHLPKLAILNLLVTVLNATTVAVEFMTALDCDMPWNERVLEICTIFGIEPTMSCRCTDCRRLRKQSPSRYFRWTRSIRLEDVEEWMEVTTAW